MLTIKVLGDEYFDEADSRVLRDTIATIELEHSLASLSKWEEVYEKPFLSEEDKTSEEVMAYIEMMILTPDVPENIVYALSQENIDDIQKYISAKRSATWFNEPKHAPRQTEKITSELIYFWMVSAQIPFEAENWHLNRLFNLIKIYNVKNTKPKKMGRHDAAQQRRDLNAARKAQLGTNG